MEGVGHVEINKHLVYSEFDKLILDVRNVSVLMQDLSVDPAIVPAESYIGRTSLVGIGNRRCNRASAVCEVDGTRLSG